MGLWIRASDRFVQTGNAKVDCEGPGGKGGRGLNAGKDDAGSGKNHFKDGTYTVCILEKRISENGMKCL